MDVSDAGEDLNKMHTWEKWGVVSGKWARAGFVTQRQAKHATPSDPSLSLSHSAAHCWPLALPLSPHTTMSRQQSPSASATLYPAHHHQHPPQHHPHHGAPLAPSTSSQSAISKQRSLPKNYTPGITAGAEDSKYQAKYKELKKKVKEIELVSILVLPIFGGNVTSDSRSLNRVLISSSILASTCVAVIVG